MVAAVGLIVAVHHAQQGALARAVFSHQRQHFARINVQADVIQRLHAGEDLGDAVELQDGPALALVVGVV